MRCGESGRQNPLRKRLWTALAAALVLVGCGGENHASAKQGVVLLTPNLDVRVPRLGDVRKVVVVVENQSDDACYVEVANVSCGCVQADQSGAEVPAGERVEMLFTVRPIMLYPKEHVITLQCRKTRKLMRCVLRATADQGVCVDPQSRDVPGSIAIGECRQVGRLLVACPAGTDAPAIDYDLAPDAAGIDLVMESPEILRTRNGVTTYEVKLNVAAIKVAPRITYECRLRVRHGERVDLAEFVITVATTAE